MGTSARVPMGDRIRTHRRTAGLTQRALASAVGVSPAYLSLIEGDKRQIGGRLLRQIAEELGVSTEAFTAVSDDRLAADLDEVSRAMPDSTNPSAAELVAFSPDWARLILALHDRSLTAEEQSGRLSDRFSRDPQSISFAHDILSRITSIRSAAEILSEFGSPTSGSVDDGHRTRFLDTLVSESARLSSVAREMIATLNESASADAAGADVREVDAYLQDRGYHFPAIEAAVEGERAPPGETPSDRFRAARDLVENAIAPLIDAELAERPFRTRGAAARARGALERYAAGALLMPYRRFRDAAISMRYDIDGLCDAFRVSFEQAAHRLASLRRPGMEGPPFAFLRVDPAGTVSKRLSTPDLRLPLFGACPLWVNYDAFSQPGRTMSQMVDLEGERFLLIARALEKAPRRQAQPPARFAIMLGVPERYAAKMVYGDGFPPGRDSVVTSAGYECRSCSRMGCAQRAHAGAPA